MTSPTPAPGTFLLGVGCQKGGTAWLHRYLEASPQFDTGFRKEYHVWDSLDLPSGRLARKRIESQGGQRAEFLQDPDRYFDYFTGLLRASEIRLTADITPGYAALSVERLAAIRDGFERSGVRPVVVFLMRDPVERIWSAVRMDLQRSGAADAAAVEERVRAMYHHPMYADRTRYDETMARLEEAFPKEAIWYGFYERLFDRDTLRALCEFLGIDFHEPDFERRVNVSPKEVGRLPDDLVCTIAQHHRAVYDAVAHRFPHLDIPEMWPSMRMLA